MFLSPIRVFSSFSIYSGLSPLLRFLAIITRQFFFAISFAVSFSRVMVEEISSPSTANEDLKIILRYSGEADTM
jgi:hypothetical protein